MSTSTTAVTTGEHATEGGILGAAAAALKRLGTAYVTWRQEQTAMADLRSMSERELADLGLARSEIDAAVRSGAARSHKSCEL